jgi:hypothetical protein
VLLLRCPLLILQENKAHALELPNSVSVAVRFNVTDIVDPDEIQIFYGQVSPRLAAVSLLGYVLVDGVSASQLPRLRAWLNRACYI